jgi:hypothetical protein
MSTHTYQFPIAPTQDQVARIRAETTAAGHPCSLIQIDGLTIVLWFDPDLLPAEVAALDEVIRAVKTELTRAERNAIQSDIDLLIAYQGVATPTLAQTAAATKAQSRILRALLRS